VEEAADGWGPQSAKNREHKEAKKKVMSSSFSGRSQKRQKIIYHSQGHGRFPAHEKVMELTGDPTHQLLLSPRATDPAALKHAVGEVSAHAERCNGFAFPLRPH